jgi:hypothetical protein
MMVRYGQTMAVFNWQFIKSNIVNRNIKYRVRGECSVLKVWKLRD